MKWDTTAILNLIDTNDEAVVRGILRIYERQTADEQSSETTNKVNGRGFNGRDAGFGTSLAKQILTWQQNPRYPTPLSRNQLDKGRKMLRKYAGQLARVVAEKEAEDAAALAEAEAEHENSIAQLRYLEDRAEAAYHAVHGWDHD